MPPPPLFYRAINTLQGRILLKEMINLVLPNESLNLFLVGDSEGKLFQFELDSFKLMKQYGDLRIGEILSGVCFRHFAFIGGSIGVCSIINLGLKSLLVKKIETSIERRQLYP